MNKKITVIELLNKIANGEELPKSIKYYGFIWQLHNGNYVENGQRMLEDYLANGIVESLNDEVEILEDNTEEIEELKRTQNVYDMTLECYHDIEKKISNDELADKINELVKAVNKLRKEKE